MIFQPLLNGIAFGSILFLIVSGLTVILGTSRILNFAHGSIFLLGGYLAYFYSTSLFGNIWMSIVLAAITVGIIGIVMERILRPTYDEDVMYQLLLTFGFIYVLYDLQITFFGATSKSLPIPPILSKTLTIFGVNITTLEIFFISVGIFSVLILMYLFHETGYGIESRATSFNPEIATTLGINKNYIRSITFALGALLAGLGGAVISIWIPLSAPAYIKYNIYAFTVLVIGGVGSIKGAYIAALLVGIFINFGALYFPKLQTIFVVLLMAVFLVIRPKGLFGREVI